MYRAVLWWIISLTATLVYAQTTQSEAVFQLSDGSCKARDDEELCSGKIKHCNYPAMIFCNESNFIERFNLRMLDRIASSIPTQVGYLVALQSLIYEDFEIGSITGTLPTELGLLTSLLYLSITDQPIEGTIPTELGTLKSIEVLMLVRTKLTGDLPKEFGLLTTLYLLQLSENSFTGSLDFITNMSRLESLLATWNKFTILPDNLTNLVQLFHFDISHNLFAGTIPTQVATFGSRPFDPSGRNPIPFFRMNNNRFSGTIPVDLGRLRNLFYFDLSFNQLVGTIPTQLANFSKYLLGFAISNNFLNGTIPTEFGLFKNLRGGSGLDWPYEGLDLSYNELTGPLPTQLANSGLTGLILEHNNINGTIPTEYGRLALRLLNLNSNKISGTIPSQLNMKKLATITLNSNELSGTFPPQIFSTDTPRRIDVSYNQLSGQLVVAGSMFSKTSLGFEEFDVSSNNLDGVRLERLESLNYFDARINYLTSISVQYCDSLVYLDASYNYLTALPDFLYSRYGDEKMKFVYLQSNHLSEPIPAASLLPNLVILDLSSNLLHGPNPLLYFERNITNCSCSMSLVNLDLNNFTGANYELRQETRYLMENQSARERCWVECCNAGLEPHVGEAIPDHCIKRSTKMLKPQRNFCGDNQFLKGFKVCVDCFTKMWTPVLYDTPLSFTSMWGSTVASILNLHENASFGDLGYCSKCDDGVMGKSFVKDPLCPSAGQLITTVSCSFPCRTLPDNSDAERILEGLQREMAKANASLVSGIMDAMCGTTLSISPVVEYHRFVLWDWFFRYILKSRSFYFTLSYYPPTELCSPNKIWAAFEIVAKKILMNSPPKIFDVIQQSDNSTQAFLSEPIPRDGVIMICSGIALVAIVVVLIALYLYYFKSELHVLPDEISWSFLMKLRNPLRWNFIGSRNSGYYYSDLNEGSSEFNKVQRLFYDFHSDASFNRCAIKSIVAIYNPSLTSSFIHKWTGMQKRLALSSNLFNKDYKVKSRNNPNAEKINDFRDWTYGLYEQKVNSYPFNKNLNVPLVSVLHATDFVKAGFISMTGFASLSLVDAGYYGKGIYFTSHAYYSLPYLSKYSDPAILLSWIAPGNVYPVVENPGIGGKKPTQISTTPLLAAPLKSGFDSHYVITSLDGYPCLNDGSKYYDEFVIVQEHQILPAFILRFGQNDVGELFVRYQKELYTIKMKEIDEAMPLEGAQTTTAVHRPRIQSISDDFDPATLMKKIQQLELIIDKQEELITDAEVRDVRATVEYLNLKHQVNMDDDRLDMAHYSHHQSDSSQSSIPLMNLADDDSI